MTDRLIVLKGGKLIDGTGADPIEDAVVVIRGNKIAAVGAAATVEYPPEARVLDVAGKTGTPETCVVLND